MILLTAGALSIANHNDFSNFIDYIWCLVGILVCFWAVNDIEKLTKIKD